MQKAKIADQVSSKAGAYALIFIPRDTLTEALVAREVEKEKVAPALAKACADLQ